MGKGEEDMGKPNSSSPMRSSTLPPCKLLPSPCNRHINAPSPLSHSPRYRPTNSPNRPTSVRLLTKVRAWAHAGRVSCGGCVDASVPAQAWEHGMIGTVPSPPDCTLPPIHLSHALDIHMKTMSQGIWSTSVVNCNSTYPLQSC
eukprot:scaffold79879_cov15-Tisochrysis_lutea.AAC.1